MADSVWILDASVAVAWFFTDEPSRDRALKVRAHMCDHASNYVVPHLFHSEVAHVLARKSGRDREFATRAHGLLLNLGFRTLALSQEAINRVSHWTCACGLSGYDATYVALAEDLRGRWLTSDEKAVKLAGTDVCCLLDSWGT